ncbi:MAG: alpha/beta hydrolase [Nitriliruptoraceae bacterium]|nr:alpha/beta hydrolase [Nitriliruptoraceae bacterium]
MDEQAGVVGPALYRYGPGPDRVLERWQPVGPAPDAGWPVVVLLHGGYWRQRYDRALMVPLARALAERGYLAINLEYRRVGGTGGWPWTGDDVLAGLAALVGPAGRGGDLQRLALVGHSAGGHLALWAAGRLAAAAGPTVRATAAVVALAPVADLRAAERDALSDHAARVLLRASPSQAPTRWDDADPLTSAGHGTATLVVHGSGDEDVPIEQSTVYVEAARAAGTPVTFHRDDADHFACIDPATPTCARWFDWLHERVSGR